MDDSDVNGVTSAQIAEQSSREKLSLEDVSALLHTKKVGIVLAATLFLVFIVLFPLPLYRTGHLFSERYSTFYLVLTFLIA